MISFTSEQRYYIYPGPMDMRKDIDGLAGVVRNDMQLDPTRRNGVFIFLSKKRNIMKILTRGLDRFELFKIRLVKFRLVMSAGIDKLGNATKSALNYIEKEWKAMKRIIDSGEAEISNNVCERQMRIIATLRNNSLFWGSHTSAERLATILTVVESCKLNKLNAYDYMVDMLKHLRSHTGDLAQVLANKWKPTTQVLTMYAPVLAQK